MKQLSFTLLFALSLLLTAAAVGQADQTKCQTVGGVLMTNIGAINGNHIPPTNLGPVFGDLAGSVAATILGQDGQGNYLVQHYWVTATGDTIKLKQAVLKPATTSEAGVVPVLWGNYSSAIAGGTGKYANATGVLDYFGIADFNQNTLVLRYRGYVCH